MTNYTTRKEVLKAIEAEREHQDRVWGENKPQSLAGFFLILRKELQEAEDGWIGGTMGTDSPLSELVQVAATCVAALEKYGVSGNVICQNDEPDDRNKKSAQAYWNDRNGA